VTFATALKQYREYSTIQNRSHRDLVEEQRELWPIQYLLPGGAYIR